MLNGDNIDAYDFEKYYFVEKTIEYVINKKLGVRLKASDFTLTRLDLNRDFIYNDEETEVKSSSADGTAYSFRGRVGHCRDMLLNSSVGRAHDC